MRTGAKTLTRVCKRPLIFEQKRSLMHGKILYIRVGNCKWSYRRLYVSSISLSILISWWVFPQRWDIRNNWYSFAIFPYRRLSQNYHERVMFVCVNLKNDRQFCSRWTSRATRNIANPSTCKGYLAGLSIKQQTVKLFERQNWFISSWEVIIFFQSK